MVHLHMVTRHRGRSVDAAATDVYIQSVGLYVEFIASVVIR